MKPHVVVVGSFVQDLTWKCRGFPQAGETVIGTFVTGPGGKGSNRGGRRRARNCVATVFIGAVGNGDVRRGGEKPAIRPGNWRAFHPQKPKNTPRAHRGDSRQRASAQNEIITSPSAPAPICNRATSTRPDPRRGMGGQAARGESPHQNASSGSRARPARPPCSTRRVRADFWTQDPQAGRRPYSQRNGVRRARAIFSKLVPLVDDRQSGMLTEDHPQPHH